jgi:hypothetical protein
MKSFISLISFILISSYQIFAQQSPNSSFENWTSGSPDNWSTSNQSLPLIGAFTMVTKDVTSPQSGTASAKLTTVTKTIPFAGSYTLPGVLTLGKINIDILNKTASISGGSPFAGTPEKLTGYFKYLPVNNDTCAMGWGLTKWNNGIRDTIGYGAIAKKGTYDNWTYFEIPLFYRLNETPDTVNIVFLNTNPLNMNNHTGTSMWIDNLSFVYGTVGIEGVTFSKELNMYVDPGAKRLVLATSLAKTEKLDISLFNMAGIESRHWNKVMQQSTEYLDISKLTPGTYVIRISVGNRLVDTRKINILK